MFSSHSSILSEEIHFSRSARSVALELEGWAQERMLDLTCVYSVSRLVIFVIGAKNLQCEKLTVCTKWLKTIVYIPTCSTLENGTLFFKLGTRFPSSSSQVLLTVPDTQTLSKEHRIYLSLPRSLLVRSWLREVCSGKGCEIVSGFGEVPCQSYCALARGSLGYPRWPVVLAVDTPLRGPVAPCTVLFGRCLCRWSLVDVNWELSLLEWYVRSPSWTHSRWTSCFAHLC